MELTPTSIGIILGITLTITTSQYFYFKDIVFDNKEDDVYINDVIYNVSNYWGASFINSVIKMNLIKPTIYIKTTNLTIYIYPNTETDGRI